jgi:hemolysin type calcium-binding protein
VRSAILTLLIVALSATPALAAGPTLFRSESDAGVLGLDVPSLPGESRYFAVTGDGPLVFTPNPDHPPPVEVWTITAPDCQQDSGTGIVTCAAPVTALGMTGGDGAEGFEFSRTAPFPIFGGMGGGTDFVGGGIGDDYLQMGPGADVAIGDKGSDHIIGDLDDDELFGGPGRDILDAGTGIDRLFGDAGIDRLRARDGVADRRIDCGRGDDRKEHATLDSLDRAHSC